MDNWPVNKWIYMPGVIQSSEYELIWYLCAGPNNEGGFYIRAKLSMSFSDSDKISKAVKKIKYTEYERKYGKPLKSGTTHLSRYREINVNKYFDDFLPSIIYSIFSKLEIEK